MVLPFCLAVLTSCSSKTEPAIASPLAASAPVLVGLSITPATQTIFEDTPVQVFATGAYSDGSTALLTREVAWGISGGAAKVSSSGLLYAGAPSSVTVTATSGLLSAAASITVSAPSNVPAFMTASVAPAAGDDLAGPCSYDLQLFDTTHPLTGVWVIFERADSEGLWLDAGLRDLAARHRLGLMYAHQCNAASFNDIQPDAAKGPARALAVALALLATSSGHPEIASASISLFGFSAAGILSLTTAEAMPARIATVVAYAAGAVSLELRQLTPSAAQMRIPILLLANSDDNRAGNTMTAQYFYTGHIAGAPWGFAVQPGVGHCCTLSTKPVLLPWMEAILPLRTSLAGIDPSVGWTGAYTCTPDGITDGRGYTDCRFTATSIREGVFLNSDDTAWLPDAVTAAAWLAWVGNP